MSTCAICYLHPAPETLWQDKAGGALWQDKAWVAKPAYAAVKALIAGYQTGRLDKVPQAFSIEGRVIVPHEAACTCTSCVAVDLLASLVPDDEGIEGLVSAMTEELCEDHVVFREPFTVAWCEMKSRCIC
jgi:hypothetical protein